MAADPVKPRDILAPIIEDIYARLAHNVAVTRSEIRDRLEAGFQKTGHRVPHPGRPRRILVIRLDEIGDNVLNSVFLRGLRELYPDDHIDLLVKPSVYPLMERCPYVDGVLHVRPFASLMLGDLYRWMYHLCDEVIWERYYDVCILPRWDTDETMSSMFAMFSGARERIGFSEHVSPLKEKICQGADVFLTRAYMTPPHVVHEVEKGLFLLRMLGAKEPSGRLELWIGKQDVAAAKAQLQAAGGGRPVAVAVATREGRKSYPPELLARALSSLLDTDAMFFLLGGPDDAAAANIVAQALPAGRTVNLAGKTPLRVSAAIIAMSAFYMGGDTGLTHVAAASGRPVVEWFCHAKDAVTSVNSLYARFYPWRVPAIVVRPEHAAGLCARQLNVFSEVAGCGSREETHCIRGIAPDVIAHAARRFLS